ncbi:hypothetical protein MHBO_003792, partial [Bonamia ostreae]
NCKKNYRAPGTIQLARKIVIDEDYYCKKISQFSKGKTDFEIFSQREDSYEMVTHRLDITNIKNSKLKYLFLLGTEIRKKLKSSEKSFVISPRRLFSFNDGVQVLDTRIPFGSKCLKNFLQNNSKNAKMDEKIVFFLAHQILRCAFILRKIKVVHGNIDISLFYFRNLADCLNKKIVHSTDWIKWQSNFGLSLLLTRNSFLEKTFSSRKFLFSQNFDKNGFFWKDCEIFRNKEIWSWQ